MSKDLSNQINPLTTEVSRVARLAFLTALLKRWFGHKDVTGGQTYKRRAPSPFAALYLCFPVLP